VFKNRGFRVSCAWGPSSSTGAATSALTEEAFSWKNEKPAPRPDGHQAELSPVGTLRRPRVGIPLFFFLSASPRLRGLFFFRFPPPAQKSPTGPGTGPFQVLGFPGAGKPWERRIFQEKEKPRRRGGAEKKARKPTPALCRRKAPTEGGPPGAVVISLLLPGPGLFGELPMHTKPGSPYFFFFGDPRLPGFPGGSWPPFQPSGEPPRPPPKNPFCTQNPEAPRNHPG